MKWKDIERENKLASDWLLYYHQRRQEYFEAKANFSELAATAYTGMPHDSNVGNPTLKKGLQLGKIKEDELWIMTIEDVERILSPKKLIFLEVRRRAEEIKHDGDNGRPDWVGYTQCAYSEKIANHYGYEHVPSERTMRTWWRSMADIVVRVAIRRGCL